MIEKIFKIKFEWSENDLAQIAAANNLSIEQLTEQKLAEFILDDMKEDGYDVRSVEPYLTTASAS